MESADNSSPAIELETMQEIPSSDEVTNGMADEVEVLVDEGSTLNPQGMPATTSPYMRLKLGLIMNLVYRLSGNGRTAVITAIALPICFSSFDTGSDLAFSYFLFILPDRSI